MFLYLTEKEKEIAKENRKISIEVDPQYDLNNTTIYSIVDSISMDADVKSLYVPKEFESAAFFIDDVSGEILAVVLTDSINDNVRVNAESVAKALLIDVPAYQALTTELQQKFRKEETFSKPYKDFVLIIDAIIKNKKPIYSTEPDFISAVLGLNSYILTNYLGDPKMEADTLTNGKIPRIIPEFPGWLFKNDGAKIRNWAFTYVYAEFKPMNGDEPTSKILDPMPWDINESVPIPLSTLNLKDDCYTVKFNESHISAKEKNQLAIATNVTGMFLGIVFGAIGDNSKNDCTAAIALSIISDVSTTLMGVANNSSLEDITSATLGTAKNAVLAAYSSKACQKFAVNKGLIATILATKLIYFQAVIAAAGTAYTLVEITPFIVSLIDPIELTEIMQLHESNLKEACVEAIKDGTLREEYAQGEIIHPGIKLAAKSQYADWVKSGFEVKWKLDPGNGSVNLFESSTTNEGKTSVSWTLPDDKSGKVTLTAEVKDKEGDHINGSPLTFTVTLKDSLEFYRRAAIGIWTFEYDDIGNSEPAQQINKEIFYEDGTGNKLSTFVPCFPRFCNTEDKLTDHRDQWGTDPYYDLVWFISYDRAKKRYLLNFYDKRWGMTTKVVLNTRLKGMSGNLYPVYTVVANKD